MINPDEYGAVRLPNTLPEKLDYVRDIEALNGPLLAEFKGENGEPYLYYWCDRDRAQNVDRWLIFRSVPATILRYLTGLITLRELVHTAAGNVCYIVDFDGTNQPRNVWYSTIAVLHPSYLPTPESFRAAAAVIDGNLQEVVLSEHAGAETVMDYRRKYKQATTITALFGTRGRSAGAQITHKLTSGYAFWSQYQSLDRIVPTRLRAKDRGYAYASPGYVRFEVDPGVASSIREAVTIFQQERERLLASLADLRRWANAEIARLDRGSAAHKRPHSTPTSPLISRDQAERLFEQLCTTLLLNPRHLRQNCDGLHTAIKALLSYANRIAYFADSDEDQDAVMVGLAVRRQPLPDDAPVSDHVEEKKAGRRRRRSATEPD